MPVTLMPMEHLHEYFLLGCGNSLCYGRAIGWNDVNELAVAPRLKPKAEMLI